MNSCTGITPRYALSIKQPWAAMLAAGLKSIEVRRWPTTRRGKVLIHAARISDSRSQGWELMPGELSEMAHLLGGIIGEADLTGCVAYRDVASFRADLPKHRNDPSWFSGPIMYGFMFANAHFLPFRPYPGWMRFFPVPDEPPRRKAGKKNHRVGRDQNLIGMQPHGAARPACQSRHAHQSCHASQSHHAGNARQATSTPCMKQATGIGRVGGVTFRKKRSFYSLVAHGVALVTKATPPTPPTFSRPVIFSGFFQGKAVPGLPHRPEQHVPWRPASLSNYSSVACGVRFSLTLPFR
jgi:hypothetical protein